jgi:hypothetical protein
MLIFFFIFAQTNKNLIHKNYEKTITYIVGNNNEF